MSTSYLTDDQLREIAKAAETRAPYTASGIHVNYGDAEDRYVRSGGTLNDGPPVHDMTVEAWREEAIRRGGGTFLNTPFQCPLCGNIATPAQFKAAGVPPEKLDKAATQCIGRFTGAKGGLNKKLKKGQKMPQPCDWAAFGLFGTLGKGLTILLEDGTTTEVFPFAEVTDVP